jgi:hypothetical protein
MGKNKNNKANKKKLDKENRIDSYNSNYEPDSEEDVQFSHAIGEVKSLPRECRKPGIEWNGILNIPWKIENMD